MFVEFVFNFSSVVMVVVKLGLLFNVVVSLFSVFNVVGVVFMSLEKRD